MSINAAKKNELAELVKELAVVHGKVTLSSGKEADYYVDLRRATLHHRASRLIGELLRELTADWDYACVGGLTLGADPVATSVMHAEGRAIDAFVVRKEAKKHGMQRRVEGPDVVGKKVLVVEDTTTTGNSPLTAVAALREIGAEVVGVATVVDRATGAADVIAAEGLEYRYLIGLEDLGLV
ncbi:orotate phosphoribosyltransferase [Corynebacterium pseudotuberculosis]|uniref:Orotate phosphoribosyltransferase n=1 Tax=Corynebacterium pseudotuberculosis (strain C231) TaxID=681645 RepID=D9QCN6_CORP2|nr:orotate phosphoribosyltransferase [Corynebacterium pseudotuberculosis]ADK29658.1 orotate phosphoribosyltransferase [Corynebacterium pseudotuberculosis FRC41]ADL11312.1 orotate phosphoribosyltransferase [Corynebacterium pseudotuberculosis C231]ADL21724.1 orotate phosphoribosyltransferase [Corynebacterium pseudotuberculosis 1002]ADO27120.1 orotate phosphoribosyltransferase [Corynebacterium pseudotuberculosis I19]AEK93184.1 Orotate phosphoribosyltransferase [Corynebacterium pseudotuberculosis 